MNEEAREELERRIADAAIEAKTARALKRRAADNFSEYCEGTGFAGFARDLAARVRDTGRVGIHPYMLADAYSEPRDVTAAILMSAAIPVGGRRMLRQIETLRSIMGGSPADFLSSTRMVADFSAWKFGRGRGPTELQQWTDILSKALMGGRDMLFSNLDFFIRASESVIGGDLRESLEEAKFVLRLRGPGTDLSTVPVPDTAAVRRLVWAWVPRYKALSLEEAARLFRFEYPAMVWYAAQGREILLAERYDELARCEHTLQGMFRQLPLMRYDRRANFKSRRLKPLRLAASEVFGGLT